MGLFVHLTVNFHHITAESWEQTYKESLNLLNRFPAPLMRLGEEKRCDRKRYVYTSNLIQENGTDQEHWEVCGDLTSYRRAESFILYRRPERYLQRRQKGEPDKDVLWADEDSIEYVSGNGTEIFDSKTQGYPYHLAVLAAGILFESRFPGYCYVLGDIDRTQAENVIGWMNRILDKPVILPVCLDAEQLYNRLESVYKNTSLAVRRFETLFRGTDEEQSETLLRLAGKTAVFQKLADDLQSYSSLSQLGAIKLLSQILSVTQNIRDVIELVKAAGKGEKFTNEELLNVLCDHYITIDMNEREPLLLFSHNTDSLMTIDDVFGHVFMALSGAPSQIGFYIDRIELSEIFSADEPAKRSVFRQIIRDSENKCRDELTKINELIAKAEEKKRKASEPQDNKPDTEKSLEPYGIHRRNISSEEEYILRQVRTQQQKFPEPEKTAGQFGIQLKKIIDENPQYFSSEDRGDYLGDIYSASRHNGFALRESAWADIDQEQDLEILKHILAFSLITENEISFFRWRIYILEHKPLWNVWKKKESEEKPELCEP